MIILEANGARIPALGLGTFRLEGELCTQTVAAALRAGYRHIDTAAFYDNELAVGMGIRASGIDRGDVFLTTKVWPTEVADGPFQRSVEASLRRLDVDSVDLLLIHWPPKNNDVAQWARLLNEAAERGWAKNIGVSNFTTELLNQIVNISKRPIVVNQVENHPYLDQSRVRAACARHGVALIAYCPLYKAGALFEEPIIKNLSRLKGKSRAQIILRWHLQHDGAGAIPKTSNIDRLGENLDAFDFELSRDEMKEISSLSRANRRLCDYEFSPDWDYP